MARKSRDKHPAKAYIKDALGGTVTVCQFVRLAVERHVRDLARAKAKDPTFPYYFDEEAGQHILDFFGFLRHSKGEWAGQVIKLEPWQAFILWVVFGWKRRSDHTRRFRKVYEEVARKNGKSTILAGVGLYLFFADDEPGAEVYTAALKRDQARIIHGESIRMVRASAALASRIRIFKDNLNVIETASKYEPLGADADTLDGLNIHGGLIDELHAHKTRGMYDVLDTATGARRQPLIFSITTAGIPYPDSICLEERGYAEKVLKGIIEDETFFGIIYTLDDGDAWDDPAVWIKANPNLGVSVKLDDMMNKCKKAQETPSAQNNFKTKHLNVWCSSRSRWMPVESWDACFREYLLDDLRGKECYAGLDLSSTTDVTALHLVFPWTSVDGLDTYRTLSFFWVPEEGAELRSRRDRVPYPVWAEQDFLELTDGGAIDYDFIRLRINEIGRLFNIREIAGDPWNALQLLQQLEGDGFTVLKVSQGFAGMSAPSKMFEALVMSGRIHHNGNPVMRWMFDNVSVKRNANGDIRPDKEHSAEKIDGVVAAILAVDRAALRKPPTPTPTILLV